jgi:hypothetical protein
MPPGERAPRKRPTVTAPDGTGDAPASIRPRAVEVPLPEPEPELPAGGRFRVLVSIDGWTVGEEIEQPLIPRTAALVGMGYLLALGDQ